MEILSWTALGLAVLGCAFFIPGVLRRHLGAQMAGDVLWLAAFLLYAVYDAVMDRPWHLAGDIVVLAFAAYGYYRLVRERRQAQ